MKIYLVFLTFYDDGCEFTRLSAAFDTFEKAEAFVKKDLAWKDNLSISEVEVH